MTDVRQLRRKAEQEEVNLSYTRRLLQGRLDIVRRELQRRSEHDGRSLVDLLPEILAEKGRGPAHGLGRHQTVQPHAPEEYESWVNSLTPGIDVTAVSDLSDAKLEKAARALAAAEKGLSERRRGVQQVMDALAGELGRRYRDGEADVAALLADEGAMNGERRLAGQPRPRRGLAVGLPGVGAPRCARRARADGVGDLRGGRRRPPGAAALVEQAGPGHRAAGRRLDSRARTRSWPSVPARTTARTGTATWSPGCSSAAGLGPDDLGCPPRPAASTSATKAAWLVDGRAPERLAMNCSGKHAAMLSACVAAGWPTEGYLDRDHPLQQAIEARLGEAAGEPVTRGRRRRLRRAAARPVADRAGPRGPVAGRGAGGQPRAGGRRRHACAPLVRRRDRPGGHRPDVGGAGAAGEGAVPTACTSRRCPGAGAVAYKLDDGGDRGRTPTL